MYRATTKAAAVTGAAILATTAVATASASAATKGGNVACRAGFTTLKIDRAPVEGEVISDGTFTVTITDTRLKADGSGDVYGFDISWPGSPVTKFYTIVKAGPDSNVSPLYRTKGLDTSLAPGGRHYTVSNVKFCYMT